MERNLSIGQSMRITPIQAISIANTVINKGSYIKPYLIDAYVDDNNSVIKQFKGNSKSIIKESTSEIMKNSSVHALF